MTKAKNKNDIENHAETLMDLCDPDRPMLPKYMRDADDLWGDMWLNSTLTEGRRVQILVEDVFGSQAALATHAKCSLQFISDVASGRAPELLDWEGLDTPNAISSAWSVYQLLRVLLNPSYLTPERAKRFQVQPDQFPELLAALKTLRQTPSAWNSGVSFTLAQMCVLVDNDYSPADMEPQMRTPEERAAIIENLAWLRANL